MNKNMLRLAILGLILVIIGFIGIASNKFNFGDELTEYHKKWNIEDNTLSQLIVNSEYNTEIEFVQSTDGSQTIEISGPLEDSVITDLEQYQSMNGKFEINLVDDVIHFINISFKSHKVMLTVALPDLNQLQEVDLHFNSGNGTVTNLNAKDIELTVKSGKLTVRSLVADQLVIKSNSGNITASNIEANADVSIHSGNMNITEYTGIGAFSSRSGNIKLQQKGASSLDISANSGKVNLTVDPDFKGSYDLDANSGNIDSPESPRLTDDLIKIRTSSGDIRIN
ncbi:DUF4097 family beta strand repeat-containing protein [Paenibacillus crassostreae]|uniref:DUF4097 domain-containing protein n=1 Tax=Paenibacillus crassostreae TaxID=1763538 RepID=A0A167FK29_9BACL|nr:DUF4097 family beta strand repeat-containing protein [Paenibacillus crassostreae]AOZ94321.1 hypothetical protein LPB68_20360 [Paenibacillus crassostreae]OAB76641.1 hypothetical protein PNBC_04380 [Paenibacillus crassostreae]